MVNPQHGRLVAVLLLIPATTAVGQVSPRLPVPSPRQLAWHDLEYSAFIHFGLNTYTDREWGYGDESPSLFNPVEFDADRVVRIFRDAGMRSIILTAKHHDGFCLWPTKFTAHSVRSSPWKNGQGDVVRAFSDACQKYGLKFGVYLSPWDRNRADYGRQEYVEYYRTQLRELLTNYGEISEVWFDGANGGDGFYGGARETRTIDRRTYYDWPTTWALVRQWQPNAVMFSDVGPDVRWVGNEQGFAGETNWAAYSPVGIDGDAPAPGYTRYLEGVEGHANGAAWIPAECDVSIRPGWFYHASEDALVKSPLDLMKLYLRSVGRNAAWLLNVPLDRRGLVAPADSAALLGFRSLREQCFQGAVSVPLQQAEGVDSIWNAVFDRPTEFNGVELGEDIMQGQRIGGFRIEAWKDGGWTTIAQGTTIGRKRIILAETTTTERIRLIATSYLAAPQLVAVRVYRVPSDVHAALRAAS
jgi:alpha-L-fucosidase